MASTVYIYIYMRSQSHIKNTAPPGPDIDHIHAPSPPVAQTAFDLAHALESPPAFLGLRPRKRLLVKRKLVPVVDLGLLRPETRRPRRRAAPLDMRLARKRTDATIDDVRETRGAARRSRTRRPRRRRGSRTRREIDLVEAPPVRSVPIGIIIETRLEVAAAIAPHAPSQLGVLLLERADLPTQLLALLTHELVHAGAVVVGDAVGGGAAELGVVRGEELDARAELLRLALRLVGFARLGLVAGVGFAVERGQRGNLLLERRGAARGGFGGTLGRGQGGFELGDAGVRRGDVAAVLLGLGGGLLEVLLQIGELACGRGRGLFGLSQGGFEGGDLGGEGGDLRGGLRELCMEVGQL